MALLTMTVSCAQAQIGAVRVRMEQTSKSDTTSWKIIGQGVQVMKGDTLVAEAYEPASLRDSFGKAPPALKLVKKKK